MQKSISELDFLMSLMPHLFLELFPFSYKPAYLKQTRGDEKWMELLKIATATKIFLYSIFFFFLEEDELCF